MQDARKIAFRIKHLGKQSPRHGVAGAGLPRALEAGRQSAEATFGEAAGGVW
jgi:hypothetical protein